MLFLPIYKSKYCDIIGVTLVLFKFKLAICLDKLIINSWKILFVIFGFSIILFMFNNKFFISFAEGFLIIILFSSS